MSAFKFCKMQSLGNDFVVIDAVQQKVNLTPELIRNLARRKQGIGCDQVLVVGPSEQADFSYTIYNADGSQASHCGNGARCVARFIQEQGLSDKRTLSLALRDHVITAEVISYDHITVDMGIPKLEKSFTWEHEGRTWEVNPVMLGNPHAILQTPPLTETQMNAMGAALNQHPQFKDGVNMSFMQVRDSAHIDLQVYERGVGLTLACGSAASAASAFAIERCNNERRVHVTMPGGQCDVAWPSSNASIQLIGDAVFVFKGQWHDHTA